MVVRASGRIGSWSTMAATVSPSMATQTLEVPSRAVLRRTWRMAAVRGRSRATQASLPRATRTAVDLAFDALAVVLEHRLREGELEAALARRAHERRREDVRRHLVERGREAENLVGGAAVEGVDLAQGRPAGGEGAGLVEQQDGGPSERLERRAALDDDAARSATREAGDDRHRSGENQRTGRRHDEHRQRPDGIAAPPPGERRERERQRQEDQGVAVGEADERRLRRSAPPAPAGRCRRRCSRRRSPPPAGRTVRRR